MNPREHTLYWSSSLISVPDIPDSLQLSSFPAKQLKVFHFPLLYTGSTIVSASTAKKEDQRPSPLGADNGNLLYGVETRVPSVRRITFLKSFGNLVISYHHCHHTNFCMDWWMCCYVKSPACCSHSRVSLEGLLLHSFQLLEVDAVVQEVDCAVSDTDSWWL